MAEYRVCLLTKEVLFSTLFCFTLSLLYCTFSYYFVPYCAQLYTLQYISSYFIYC